MEKVRNFLRSLIAFAAFLSLYIGGVTVYLLLLSVIAYAGFELAVMLAKKARLRRQ
ncbi:hypothetical protein [Candidatus Enterococcus huntleyi]|uniref:hypothetical protein n=1 Tax=Candidatus Enterococcus huntleyi TaxID=1857217 RepID=UPI00137B2F1B|nr:hypothetical protein [Enterococcus sp. JM4C]